MSNHNGQLAQLILHARTEAGLTRAQLAVRVGVTRNTIHRWEEYNCAPQPRYLTMLAEAFDLEPEELDAYVPRQGEDDGIGARLRRVRFQLGLTQTALASKLEVSQSTVSSWEQGIRTPNRGSTAAINKFLEENQ